MNKKLIIVAAAAGALIASACVGNGGDAPVKILGTFAANPECTVNTAVQQGGASFDLAGVRQLGANAASFADVLVTVQLRSEFSTQTTSAGGQTLSNASRNGAYIDQVELSYTSTPAISFETETSPMAGFIEAGGTLNAVTDLLGTKAAQKLLDTVSAGAEVHEVITTLRFRGYTAGSSGATFTTNDIEFPIRVFDTGVTCPAGPASDGPCGSISGQGGAVTCNAAGDAGTP